MLQNPELVALQALRKIQTAVMAGHLALVKCRMAPMPALFLLNNKRCDLNELEDEYGVKIVVLADSRLLPDDYEIQLEASQAKSRGVSGTSKSTRSRRNVLKRARERKSRRGEDENGSQASAKSADNTNAVDPSDSKAEGDHLDDVDSAATADS